MLRQSLGEESVPLQATFDFLSDLSLFGFRERPINEYQTKLACVGFWVVFFFFAGNNSEHPAFIQLAMPPQTESDVCTGRKASHTQGLGALTGTGVCYHAP